MAVPIQQFKPIGTLAVDLSVASTLVSGVVTVVSITLRSRAVIATPATFITDNSLEAEVISRAGLDEATTFASYVLVSSDQQGADYLYIITAALT